MYYQIFFILMVILYTAQLFPGGKASKGYTTDGIELQPINSVSFIETSIIHPEDSNNGHSFIQLTGNLVGLISQEEGQQLEAWKKLAAVILGMNTYKPLRFKNELKAKLDIKDYGNRDPFCLKAKNILNQELQGRDNLEVLYSALTSWIQEELTTRNPNKRFSTGHTLQSAE